MTRAIDKLRVNWTKADGGDLKAYWTIGGGKHDAHYLFGLFDRDFREEMNKRGYDINTLKFSIERIINPSETAYE